MMSTPSCPHRRTKRLFMFQGEHSTHSLSLRLSVGEVSRPEAPWRTNRSNRSESWAPLTAGPLPIDL